ncbi:MAG: hypothetical protein JKY95_19775 [Planctomycetaceae bacterium]|nr:hypothetical protein [Planctomycetaceae bacterium]
MNNKCNLLAAQMLADYCDKLSDNCCNDWEYPDDWTLEEKQKFKKDYHDWNGDPEVYDDDHLNLPDFAVAALLSAQLECTVTTKMPK